MCHISPVSPDPTTATPAFDVVLFDLDGTLTDSAPGIIACLTYALECLGIAPPDPVTMRSHLGPPLASTLRDHYGVDDEGIAFAIAKYRERYHHLGEYENAVFDGIPELLADLAASGMTLAVATSKPTESATRILEHFGLAGAFAFIGGAEMHGPRQHKADVIEHTLDSLVAQGRMRPGDATVMIGDREHDIRGARAHGIPGIGVLWGYGDENELLIAGAVQVVSTPAALGVALLG
jgi:phosphoglycolate phosphatase